MKTIEEKATSYAGRIILDYRHTSDVEFDLTQTAALGKECRDAYLAGSEEALAGQWRKDDDIEGLQDGKQVIVAIQRVDNSIKYFYAAYFQNGKFWYESDNTEVYSFNLWMPLPEPPKDESHV